MDMMLLFNFTHSMEDSVSTLMLILDLDHNHSLLLLFNLSHTTSIVIHRTYGVKIEEKSQVLVSVQIINLQNIVCQILVKNQNVKMF